MRGSPFGKGFMKAPSVLTHYIITVRDKNGKVIQNHERDGKESALSCISELMDNPTWRISVRQA